jgi:hypothetical protein
MSTAIQINLTHAVGEEAENLLLEADMLSDLIFTTEGTIVRIEIAKGALNTLTNLCAKVDEQAREKIKAQLQKAETKLILAERRVEHLIREKETGLDPRVEKIMAKVESKCSAITAQTEGRLPIDTKLFRWQEKLDNLLLENHNPITTLAIKKGISLIDDTYLQILQSSPHFVDSECSLCSKKNDNYYKNLPDPAKCKKMACTRLAKNYLHLAQRKSHEPKFYYIEEDAHLWTAEFIRVKNPTHFISVDEMFSCRFDPDHPFNFRLEADVYPLTEVPFSETFLSKHPEIEDNLLSYPPQSAISYNPGASQEQIEGNLATLLQLKAEQQLESMGAFIEIPPQTLAIVFHSSGRISVFNPLGDHEKENYFEVNFGNLRQTAAFLKKRTAEIAPQHPIAIKPYCNPWRRLNALDPSEELYS